MSDRRQFLKTGAAAIVADPDAVVIPSPAILREARAFIRRGRLGRIAFCRIGHERFLPALLFVIDQARAACPIEVDRSAPGMSVLGSAATLSVTNAACRLHPGGA